MEPISEALAVIENACKISNIVRLNKHQCKRIADRISSIREVLYKNFVSGKALEWSNDYLPLGDLHLSDPCVDDSSIQAVTQCGSSGVVVVSKYPQASHSQETYQWCGSTAQGPLTYKLALVFSELLTVLRKGETLLSCYKDWKGIIGVLSKTDNRRAFKEIHDDLDTIKAQFRIESMREGFANEFESASGAERSVMLIADAEKDLEEIPKLLEILCPILDSDSETKQEDDSLIASAFSSSSLLGDLNVGGSQGSDISAVVSKDTLSVPGYLRLDPSDVKLVRRLWDGSSSSKGFKEVFEVTWLSEKFALKKCKAYSPLSQDLDLELYNLTNLRHPNIEQMVGSSVVMERGEFMVVTEFMDGNLRELIDSRMRKTSRAAKDADFNTQRVVPFDNHEGMVIIDQIASGMGYIHSKGVVHRDLNSSNVSIQEYEPDYILAKIMDFGTSQFIDSSETWPTSRMAPEMLRRADKSINLNQLKAADVYSFGTTCYEILTGRLPFEDQVSLMSSPALPLELDIDLKELISDCCQPDPDNRPNFVSIIDSLKSIRSRKQLPAVIHESSADKSINLDQLKAADVYSFRTTCYEILTGRLPFEDQVSLMSSPALPLELDIDLKELISDCCQPDPDNRPNFVSIIDSSNSIRSRKQLPAVIHESSAEMYNTASETSQFFGEDVAMSPVKWTPNVQGILARLFGLMGGKKGPNDSPAYESCVSDSEHEHTFLVLKTKRLIAEILLRMKGLLKKVKIWHCQCEHLFKKYLEGVNIIDQRLAGLNAAEGGMRTLKSPLDKFISSMMDGEAMLCFCSENYYNKAAFALSSPLPFEPTFSRFALVLRELDWTLEFFCYVEQQYVYESGLFDSGWEWCEKRCRPILRGNHEVGFGARDDEVLEADGRRQARDRKALMKSLNPKPRNTSSVFCFKPGNPKDRKDYDKLKTVLRKRLLAATNNRNPSSIPDWFWIDKPKLKHIKHLANGSFKITDKSIWLGETVAVGIAKYPEDSVVEEARLLAMVQHPNVVEFMGFAYEEDTGYFVTEYMEQDLESLISQQLKIQSIEGPPFDFLVVVDILLQIVEAMIHSKRCGVIHRDLKPKNCLVSLKHQTESNPDCNNFSTYYTVKVIDFGAAKMRGENSYFGTCNQGTPFYMAPEVYGKTQKDYTWSADVYSFGMTCYHVVTGKAPFKNDTKFAEVQEFICKGERPVFPFDCPRPLMGLITRCWASIPTNRPTFEYIRQDLWQCKLDANLIL